VDSSFKEDVNLMIFTGQAQKEPGEGIIWRKSRPREKAKGGDIGGKGGMHFGGPLDNYYSF